MQKNYFKVGMKVWDSHFGEASVISITENNDFPLEVYFVTGKRTYYTYDGRYEINSNISLSQKPIPEIINEPIDDRIELPEDVVGFLHNTRHDYNTYSKLKQKYKI